MATMFMIRRTLRGIEPASAFDAGVMESIPLGEVRKATVTKARSLPLHNKYFALLNVIFPHQNQWTSLERFRKAVQRALGFVEIENGLTFDVSINWESMDGEEFELLYNRTVELIITKIIPNLDRDDLARQVDEVLAGRSGRVPDERSAA